MAITISDTTPRVQYTATSGQTTFAVNFEFFVNADLKVYNGTTLLTYDASPSSASEYSVSGAGQTGGGSITLGGGATVGDKITIYRDMAIARSTDFPTSGAFQVSSLNEELDKLTAMIQQVKNDLKYSPKAASTTSNTYDLTFPNLVANKFLTVNTGGTALEFTQDVTNVNTVAGIATDITAVSNISANVTTVAGVHANVTTVANNIASVNTVAADITKVVAVANDLAEAVSEVETVADDLNETTSEIEVVAGAITNVNNVGNDISNVNTVAGSISNVNTVAGANSNISTVAGNNSNITTVAGISSNVTTVAGISSDVTAVAADATDIGTVAGKETEIGLLGVADVITDMGLLGTSANVTAMGHLGTSANVTAMGTLGTSSNVTNMATVAGAITNVNNVGGSIANVNTVATNLSGVNSFAERYRVQAGVPSSSLDVGDLAFDTTANELKVYKSSGWAAAGSTVNGTSARFKYTASGSQTTFTGSDDNGNTLAYDAGFIDVYLNGVKLVNGTDVTVTSGTSVVLASGATANDILDIVAYGTFTLANYPPANSISGNWETKNADFTAEAGKAYFCDTSSNDIDVTLPTGVTGNTIKFVDVSGTFDTNDLTILNGSSKIMGASANLDVATERAAFELVYFNSTQGWLLTEK